MRYSNKKSFQNKAFSMIELSVFILFLALILTAIIAVKTSEKETKANKETKVRIELIQQALNNYISKNKSLPCPADLTQVKSSSSTYGTAVTATNDTCSTTSGVYESGSGTKIYYGGVPFKTLGISQENAEDGFGSKFVYVVKGQFVSSGVNYFNNPTISGTQIQVNGVNSNAMYLLMSGGKNKSGFFNANSPSSNSASSRTDEIENSNATLNSNFIALSTQNGFDDILVYKARDQILGEIKADTTTKKCLGSNASNISYGGINMVWPDADPGQVITATTPCPSSCTSSLRWNNGASYPTRRCRPDGTWDSAATLACTSAACSTNCAATSETRYGVTVNWPQTAIGTVAISTTPCPTSCISGSSWNAGVSYPSKMCNSNGTWGAFQNECTQQPCCSVNNGYTAENATYSGASTILYNNQNLSMTCNSGYGRAVVGGTRSSDNASQTCDRSTTDRTNTAPSVTCNNGVLSAVSNPCSACRNCGAWNYAEVDGNKIFFVDQYNCWVKFPNTAFGITSTNHNASSGNICKYTYNRNSLHSYGVCRFARVIANTTCQDGSYTQNTITRTAQDCLNGEAHSTRNCDEKSQGDFLGSGATFYGSAPAFDYGNSYQCMISI